MKPEKQCSRCGVVKTASEFWVIFARSGKAAGTRSLSGPCKPCQKTYGREWMRKNRRRLAMGVTHEEFEALSKAQNGKCALCQRPPGKKGLSVDHDHWSGRMTSLLCGNCNTALGLMQDSPVLLRRAARYLERGRLLDDVVAPKKKAS